MDVHVKAARAKQLLEDVVLKEALDVLLSEQIGVFESPSASQEEIMEAHRMVRSLSQLKAKLQSFVNDGRFLQRRQDKVRHRG